MSLFSVKRPVVMYSGARYPMAALTFRAEKTTSSARSLGSPASMINGLNSLSRRTFSTDIFWCTIEGLLASSLCRYPIPDHKRKHKVGLNMFLLPTNISFFAISPCKLS
jgi:hypothetical protein